MAEMVSNTTSLLDEQVGTFCEAHTLSTVKAWVTVQFTQQLCSRASTSLACRFFSPGAIMGQVLFDISLDNGKVLYASLLGQGLSS